MNRQSLIGCAVLAALALALTALHLAGQVNTEDPRQYPKLVDPNEPAKLRATASPAKREQLGLKAHTWPGVVHPDVYPTFDRLEKTVKGLKRRLAATDGRDVAALSTLWRIHFPGTVYVQIQLRERAAQQRVLQSLTAAELHDPYLFEAQPAILACATRAGLDKLAHDPDVAGICLDDQPLVRPRQIIHQGELPPADPNAPACEFAPELCRAFQLADRIDVSVYLRTGGPTPPPDESPVVGDPTSAYAAQERENRATQLLADRVLDTVTADDFWLTSRHRTLLSGKISRQGVSKLSASPDVQSIILPQIMELQKPVVGHRVFP